MQLVTPGNNTIGARLRRSWIALDPSWRWGLFLFLCYRLLLTSWLALVSAAYPYLPAEAAVPLQPGAVPWDLWLRRAVLWPNVRYDVLWYLGIAEHGYSYRAGSTAFHPLYPLLTGLLGRLLGGHFLLAAWLIAQVCCVGWLVLLYRLVRLDYDAGVAQRTTWFLLGSPLGLAFLIPYTESLLLLCIVGAFYAARKQRWWLAGLAGAGAALTKQPGVIVLAPLLWELLRQRRAHNLALRDLLRPLLGLALVPLGLLAFVGYRATLNDVAFSWQDPASLIHALIVTPSYAEVWVEYFSWPWNSLVLALSQLRSRPYFYLIFNTFLMLVMLVILIYSVLRQHGPYALFSALLALLNMSIIYPYWPYMGILRRFTIIFPIFIQLAIWGRPRPLRLLIAGVQLLLWLYVSTAYVFHAFVP